MPDFKFYFNRILNDIKVELTDEFDQNFERKAFFNKGWPVAKYPNHKGALLIRSGKLRRSIKAKLQGHSVHWASSEPHASIQNNGGVITVTAKMKRYFWAMYRQATGGKNKSATVEAMFWKAMALKKVGSQIKIPARKFIGSHPKVDKIVRQQVDAGVQALGKHLLDGLRP